jgi:hypothetical protein
VKRSARLLKASSPWIVLAIVLLLPVLLVGKGWTLFASPHAHHARRNADVRTHVAAMHRSVDDLHNTLRDQVRATAPAPLHAGPLENPTCAGSEPPQCGTPHVENRSAGTPFCACRAASEISYPGPGQALCEGAGCWQQGVCAEVSARMQRACRYCQAS